MISYFIALFVKLTSNFWVLQGKSYTHFVWCMKYEPFYIFRIKFENSEISCLYEQQWRTLHYGVSTTVHYTAILNSWISAFIYWKQTTRACLLQWTCGKHWHFPQMSCLRVNWSQMGSGIFVRWWAVTWAGEKYWKLWKGR